MSSCEYLQSCRCYGIVYKSLLFPISNEFTIKEDNYLTSPKKHSFPLTHCNISHESGFLIRGNCNRAKYLRGPPCMSSRLALESEKLVQTWLEKGVYTFIVFNVKDREVCASNRNIRRLVGTITQIIAVFVSGPQYETLPNCQPLQGLS